MLTYPLRTKAKGRETMLEALLSVVAAFISIPVLLAPSVVAVGSGRVAPVRLPTPTVYTSILPLSIRQITAIVSTVSPSAAST